MCISSSLRPGRWSGCSVRTLLTLKLRCTPGDKEHYEKVWGRGLGQQRILNGSREEGPLSTVQLVNGVTYPKLSNAVLGTAVKGYSEKKVGMNRGHFVPQAVIRRFCCNLVAFCLSPPSYWKTFFQTESFKEPHTVKPGEAGQPWWRAQRAAIVEAWTESWFQIIVRSLL